MVLGETDLEKNWKWTWLISINKNIRTGNRAKLGKVKY
jgi:hypothetical protein